MFVVLTRHAERDPIGSDPSLSAAGRVRARLLAAMLADAGIDAVFVSEVKRTQQTAAPLASMRGLTPATLETDITRARLQVRAAGQRVLVVGHSNTVPRLIEALGGPAGVEIDDHVFNRLFVLQVEDSSAELLSMTYGANS